MSVDRWYESFFNENALDIWQESRSEALTLEEASYLARMLALESGGSILDLACGNGRHAVALAMAGHRVTGIDITEANRERALARAAENGVEIEFLLGDMSELAVAGTFGGAYCWGNSLGYFPRPAMKSFFAGAARALEPGARLVLQSATVAESILGDLSRSCWVSVGDNTRVMLASSYDARVSRLDTEYTTLREGKEVDVSTAHVWIFTSGELVEMAAAAGFDVVTMHSDLDGNEYGLGCDDLMLTLVRT